ncbi:hypothetical protein C8R46DRAFT_1291466 [Mycena filopes]|nr:hypothetical protein C8R46DRAFT_1291466 [Mycena filopes]
MHDEPVWGPHPITLSEQGMYECCAGCSKVEWQRKAADPQIRDKWRKEALEQAATAAAVEDATLRDRLMTEKMIEYVLAELDGYATTADNGRGIERACFEAIWYSDRLISDARLQQLKTAVKLLEDVWYPGSNDRVLDLVHPSVSSTAARTRTAHPRSAPQPILFPCAHRRPNQEEWTSEDFCWLPSDFAIAEDGTASAYINNLHPERHATRSLYRIVEEVLSAFVPVFERVLGDVNREGGSHTNSPLFGDSGRLRPIECIWGRDERPYPKEEPESDEDIDDFNRRFWESIEKTLPEANRYSGHLEDGFKPVELRGRTTRNMKGGIGMSREWSTKASLLLYYDEENITESELSFRVPTAEPSYHMQGDSECMRALNEECVQDIGAVVTKAGRALAWPNLFQHCVSFELADATKPGHRKILAFLLVDPTKEHIVSASDVPPQQAEWAAEAFRDAAEAGSVVGKRFDRALFSGDSDDS